MIKLKKSKSLLIIFLMLISTLNILSQTQPVKSNNSIAGLAALDEGRIKDAFDLLKKDVDEAQKSGKEDKPLAQAINNLGELYRRIGRFADAETLFRKAMEIAVKISDKTLEGITKNNLGLVYSAQGSAEQAIAFTEEALKIREQLFGKESFDYAITLDNLASAYANKKDFAKAEELTKMALSYFIKYKGITDADTIVAFNNLVEFYKAQEKKDKVLELYQEQISLIENKFGMDSEKLLNPLQKLAVSQMNFDYHNAAEQIFRRCLTLLEKNKIAVYPQQVYAFSLLGVSLTKQNKNPEAEDFFRKAIDGIDVEGAKKSPNATNIAVSVYVQFLKENKRTDEASALEVKIRKMFEQ
jgi:tetratricopeptide (TPR) repeat protein